MKRTDVLNKKQVLAIPKLLEKRNIREVAEKYGVTWQAIYYWIKQLRERGIEVKTLKQGKKLLLGSKVANKPKPNDIQN